MLIRLGFDISLSCAQPTPSLFKLSVAQDRRADLRRPESIECDNGLTLEPYWDAFGNLCHRGLMRSGRTRLRLETFIEDPALLDPQAHDAQEIPLSRLPPETLRFLQPSRYCESDILSNFAWSQFGGTNPGWERAQAIVDFAHAQIQFGYQWANMFRTAQGAMNERVGVCRDYAHLAIALLRAMNIPARYCNGYLGDIGVPPDPAPMDFSAWCEAYLGGRWFTFDARHLKPRAGRVVISRGMDATDCAMVHTFGFHALDSFTVISQEITPDQAKAMSEGKATVAS
jgi:transglutaminase-like putative cysteine protease